MGLYNRLTNQNRPSEWSDNHQPADANDNPINTDKNPDWFRWSLGVHQFTDVLVLMIEEVINGSLAQQKALIKTLFDMSDTEVDQTVELYSSFISAGVINGTSGDDPETKRQKRMNNLIAFQSLVRSMQQEMPQRFIGDVHTWFYDTVGITIPDDR